jgi:hypothetical protein
VKIFSILILLLLFLGACTIITPQYISHEEIPTITPSPFSTIELSNLNKSILPTNTIIEPVATPNPFSNLYGCAMEIKFISGPLESKGTQFKVLNKDYFFDKGDQFFPGKKTGVFYEEQHYFIIHSSYVNGDIFKPLEAEFIRIYLESWGDTSLDYIQKQIELINQSMIVWTCNESQIFLTQINGIIRLSHEASYDLWLEPSTLEQILKERKGINSEWIGEINETEKPTIYIGFCGWGPSSLGDERFSYFRYLMALEVLQTYPRK